MSQTMETSSTTSTSSSGGASRTTTTTKQVTRTTKTTSSTVVKKSSSSSRSISVQSSSSSFSDLFGSQRGIDVESEMKKLMDSAHTERDSARTSLFRLTSLEPTGSGSEVIKLDSKSVMDYVDQADKDRLKFNFDVSGYQSQTVTVRSDGNKIEVHAKKSSKIGDEERSEEFSRTYEMPNQDALDPSKVSSNFFKDGILSVELPVNLAVGQ